jgi:hypothetical protein
MILTRTPASLPSAVNAVVADMARVVDGLDVQTPRGSQSAFNWRVTPYSGGSDHMQFIDRGIPGVMLGHSPDYTHHTSDDTPDRVDPVELERAEILATGTMLYLASLTETEALDLADRVGSEGLTRIGAAGSEARRMAAAAPSEGMELSPVGEAGNLVAQVAGWERQALTSVLGFHDSPAVRRTVDTWTGRLADLAISIGTQIREEAGADPDAVVSHERADERIPRRLTRGPLDFGLPGSQLEREAAAWYSSRDFPFSGNARFELVNFIDGSRSVTAIRDALSAEFGPMPTAAVARYLEDLVEVGVVEWAPSGEGL